MNSLVQQCSELKVLIVQQRQTTCPLVVVVFLGWTEVVGASWPSSQLRLMEE